MAKKHDWRRLIQTTFRESGLTIKAVADGASVPYAAAHGLLTGDRNTTLGITERICKVLNLQLVNRKGA